MKKLFAGLLVAFLMASGLVALTGTASSAAPRCPYTGCIDTSTNVRATSPAPRRIRVVTTVRAGNATPRGSVKITVKGNNDVFRTRTVRAGRGVVTTFTVRPGQYLVRATFLPARNSAFARSTNTDLVKVKPRPRRR